MHLASILTYYLVSSFDSPQFVRHILSLRDCDDWRNSDTTIWCAYNEIEVMWCRNIGDVHIKLTTGIAQNFQKCSTAIGGIQNHTIGSNGCCCSWCSTCQCAS